MDTPERLRSDIRAVFGSVPFPTQCGLRAACLIDDWESDPIILADTTARQDVHGEWWEIPARELRECQRGLTYLDECNLGFYLPAYLTLALDDQGRGWMALCLLDAGSEDDEQGSPSSGEELVELGMTRNQWNIIAKERLVQKFSRIIGAKRDVCLRFLVYASEHFDPSPHAFYGRGDAVRILQQEFWKQAAADHR